jgi:hypothetical protein
MNGHADLHADAARRTPRVTAPRGRCAAPFGARSLALTLALFACATVSMFVQASAARGDVVVTVNPALAGPRIDGRFLGFSVEMSAARRLASYANRGNLVALMRSLGPGVLRLGGISADLDTAFVPPGGVRPPWAHDVVSAADLDGIALLLRKTGWKAILTVNLGRFDPVRAAQQVAAARQRLGPDLIGIQVGNEPDNYAAQYELRDASWGASPHVAEVHEYRRVIAAAAPGIPILGPDLASWNQLGWLASFADAVRPRFLTAHYYPLPSCTESPSLRALSSPRTRQDQARVLKSLASVARASGLPLRLTETNSGPCGGQQGVSDSPTSALWVVDYLLSVARAGISGVNLHGGPGRCMSYSPMCTRSDAHARRGQVTVRPIWYGLLLTRRLVGDRLVSANVRSGRSDITVTALRSRSGVLHVVAVNYGRRANATSLVLQAPRRYKTGRILRLQTRPSATRPVTLGGTAVRADGTWRPAAEPPVVRRGGAFRFQLRGGSAVLVTLRTR